MRGYLDRSNFQMSDFQAYFNEVEESKRPAMIDELIPVINNIIKRHRNGAPSPATVKFVYDEIVRKWDPLVECVADEVEARQAFNAVVLSVGMLNPLLYNHHRVESIGSGYRIHPAV